MIAKEVNPW